MVPLKHFLNTSGEGLYRLMEKGIVFDIQRYSIHDGPGIRTLVFLKGCDLSCPWCCNPESQRFEPELLFHPERCIGCEACLDVCIHRAISSLDGKMHFNRDLCENCCACSEVCYGEARLKKGAEMGADEVVDEVLKDQIFYANSDGGVTLSGGEPLAQIDFAASILRGCRDKGVHTALETAGHIRWSQMEKVVPHTDLFLYDVKHMDSEIHHRYVGVSNGLILANLKKLAQMGNEIVVRTPIIPGFNDGIDEIRAIARHVALLGIREMHLLPYHHYGKGKYRLLGREYPFGAKEAPEKSRTETLRETVASEGLVVHLGG